MVADGVDQGESVGGEVVWCGGRLKGVEFDQRGMSVGVIEAKFDQGVRVMREVSCGCGVKFDRGLEGVAWGGRCVGVREER